MLDRRELLQQKPACQIVALIYRPDFLLLKLIQENHKTLSIFSFFPSVSQIQQEGANSFTAVVTSWFPPSPQ